jgi:secondary thiamine-phosphate synthase enzyme
MHSIAVKTRNRIELIDVTGVIRKLVAGEEFSDGFLMAYVPHTTAAITINENADPDVGHDMLDSLNQIAPEGLRQYRHAEGNSDAHIKASLLGASVMIIVEKGELCLGTWQGIYFCEFDGPRNRRLMVKFSR